MNVRNSHAHAPHTPGQIDAINDAFAAARDEIEYAAEDAETVHFNESFADAKKLVDDALGRYAAVCAALSDGERGKLQRSMGLKLEQLKAELSELEHTHA